MSQSNPKGDSNKPDQPNEPKKMIADLGKLPAQIQAKIHTQFTNQVEAAKTLSQGLSPKLDQTLVETQKSLEENLEVADAWAIAQANQVIEQGVENLENLKTKAQKKYEETVGKATKQAAKTSDRFQNVAKNAMKSAWQKINKSN